MLIYVTLIEHSYFSLNECVFKSLFTVRFFKKKNYTLYKILRKHINKN